jgi:hypothetical protein
MEQFTSQLGALELRLEDDLLDRIDQIVPPGMNFSFADAGYSPPSVAKPAERRRPAR